MIIEFRLGNYKSFKDIGVFSLIASNDNKHVDKNIISFKFPYSSREKEIRLLKSAVIYGANASGKSNLLNALKFMQSFVFNSSKNTQITEDIPIERCLVSSKSENMPSHFELTFIHQNILYRYGFEVTDKEITSEWLFSSPKGREALLFVRDNNLIEIGDSFKEGRGLEDKTRNNALFLSVCAQFNGETSASIIKWFRSFNVISGIEDKSYLQYTLNKLEDKEFYCEIEKFIHIADLGIEELKFEQRDVNFEDLDEEIKNHILGMNDVRKFIKSNIDYKKEINIKTVEDRFNFLHSKYNDENKKIGNVPFKMDQESQGTQKLFAVAGPIIDTLKNGKTIFIDELDTRLHPLLTQFIIHLFNSNETNKKGSQLIFATHDTNLLSSRFFRRDQIWFIEKNKYNVSDIYSLSDYRVRKDATFNKDYIMGKYGAIPYINSDNLFEE
ncbi:ATP-binding protein [Marispirochaeta sp.]|uniref:AAA family ATPase n=1 Tax=Marispirochaeta sp. TaxID=2038653 RepID=UPI0029C6335E|nr:ATP-binding protein [Marispirochaeta sp.]